MRPSSSVSIHLDPPVGADTSMSCPPHSCLRSLQQEQQSLGGHSESVPVSTLSGEYEGEIGIGDQPSLHRLGVGSIGISSWAVTFIEEGRLRLASEPVRRGSGTFVKRRSAMA